MPERSDEDIGPAEDEVGESETAEEEEEPEGGHPSLYGPGYPGAGGHGLGYTGHEPADYGEETRDSVERPEEPPPKEDQESRGEPGKDDQPSSAPKGS